MDECIDLGVFLGLELYVRGAIRDAADENGLYEAAGVLLIKTVSVGANALGEMCKLCDCCEV